MNIVVCIKQVPGTNKVDIDPETGVLKRDGVDSKMNPYDLYAVETALQIKEQYGGKISAITMGPPQAEAIIKEAYMMGVYKGYILSDRKFAGSDVLATSYTLAQGIKKLGNFDLIICGKQTTDGDTAQVGSSIAENLKIPHVTWVREIEKIEKDYMIVEQNMADSFEVVKLSFPCLISVEKDIFTPRLPSYKKMMETKNREITYYSLIDLVDSNAEHYGLNGSPTQVERIFQPTGNTEHIIWNDNETKAAEELFDTLIREKYIKVD